MWTKGDKIALKVLSGMLLVVVGILAVELSIPVAWGVWYSQCGERRMEQEWLDRTIHHLKLLREEEMDPEAREVVDYTIARYSKIGGFDVMVVPCFSSDGKQYAGQNSPFCPGLTISPEVLGNYSTQQSAVLLVHEAMHDYYPYYHPYVDARIHKVEDECQRVWYRYLHR